MEQKGDEADAKSARYLPGNHHTRTSKGGDRNKHVARKEDPGLTFPSFEKAKQLIDINLFDYEKTEKVWKSLPPLDYQTQRNKGYHYVVDEGANWMYYGQVSEKTGKPHGIGIMLDYDGIYYEGYFKQGKQYGIGRSIYPNGDVIMNEVKVASPDKSSISCRNFVDFVKSKSEMDPKYECSIELSYTKGSQVIQPMNKGDIDPDEEDKESKNSEGRSQDSRMYEELQFPSNDTVAWFGVYDSSHEKIRKWLSMLPVFEYEINSKDEFKYKKSIRDSTLMYGQLEDSGAMKGVVWSLCPDSFCQLNSLNGKPHGKYRFVDARGIVEEYNFYEDIRDGVQVYRDLAKGTATYELYEMGEKLKDLHPDTPLKCMSYKEYVKFKGESARGKSD